MALTITGRAATEIKRICAEQNLNLSNTFLRLGVKGGGCSGFTYNLDLVEGKGEHDETFESQGIMLVCDPKSYLYMNGTELDFKDELIGRGFVFNNPNASSSCGCGKSFSA